MHAIFVLRHVPPDALLRITGDLDLSDHDRLCNHFADLLDCTSLDAQLGGDPVVALDLGGVGVVDGDCLRLIDTLRAEVSSTGQRFEIASASPTFYRACLRAHYDEVSRSIRARVVESGA